MSKVFRAFQELTIELRDLPSESDLLGLLLFVTMFPAANGDHSCDLSVRKARIQTAYFMFVGV
ncbi:hypothetical protein LBMAG46_23930 [Planctomycetia bacterium]|nr:hypothetical protein LBMAG46_23930 [Planctomycetia bacterium]